MLNQNEITNIENIDTFYLHLEFKTKDGVWSINLPFLCNQCGVCCTLDDFLTAGPIKTNQNFQLQTQLESIYASLGERWEKDKEEYDRYIMNTPCPFLEKNKCSIYSVRPEGCRQFPNTLFGMQTQDCEALNRFKKQAKALKKGWQAKKSYHSTQNPIKQSNYSKERYEKCIKILHKEGVTEGELSLFAKINAATK